MNANSLLSRRVPIHSRCYNEIRGYRSWRRSYLATRCCRFSSHSSQWSTPLARIIHDAIKTTGPISVAAYMRQCLTSAEGGYYMRKREQIGKQGDFITSPEISQAFGELVGIWFVGQWIVQGKPSSGVELIEVGPGKGTLMSDILRAMRNFSRMSKSVESVYLVEASESLRLQQHQLLCGTETVLRQIDIGWQSISKYAGIPVTWCEDIRFVPHEAAKVPFIVAHEFFDALPIHAFQSLLSVAERPSTIEGLHGPIELSKSPPAAPRPLQWRELVVTNAEPRALSTSSRPALSGAKAKDEFQLALAKASTPASLLLPEASQRYAALKGKEGSLIEISPEAHTYAAEFARRIGGVHNDFKKGGLLSTDPAHKAKPSGAALIIDYGTSNTVPTSTLRGIRTHAVVSPFSAPGEADISADVDFTALAEAAIDASDGVEVHGPIEQGEWLHRMGIQERVKALCEKAGTAGNSAETVQKIKTSAQRLTERSGGAMGKLYKVMAIIPESGGRRPLGFGGDLYE